MRNLLRDEPKVIWQTLIDHNHMLTSFRFIQVAGYLFVYIILNRVCDKIYVSVHFCRYSQSQKFFISGILNCVLPQIYEVRTTSRFLKNK